MRHTCSTAPSVDHVEGEQMTGHRYAVLERSGKAGYSELKQVATTNSETQILSLSGLIELSRVRSYKRSSRKSRHPVSFVRMPRLHQPFTIPFENERFTSHTVSGAERGQPFRIIEGTRSALSWLILSHGLVLVSSAPLPCCHANCCVDVFRTCFSLCCCAPLFRPGY